MASKFPVPDSTRPGSVTVTVSDSAGAGGFLSGALVNLYRTAAGTTTSKLNAKGWTADGTALVQSGRTDIDGQVTFARLEPAVYVVEYGHYPQTPAQCVEVESGCAASVCLQAFVIVNCGVFTAEPGLDEPGVLADLRDYLDRRDLPTPGPEPFLERVDGLRILPYLAIIRRKLPDIAINDPVRGSDLEADLCDGFIREKLRNPCLLELIWSYWHEEGMLVQTMNAISRRYQNVRGPGRPDPLVNIEVNPLRPLNNLLWGYIQDEQHRLTVARRNGEYDHEYGLRLQGRAVQAYEPADSRSKFIEAFHQLLRLCTVFYSRDDDTTVKADAFGVLNALKEVHLILSQGAHSQFGDLPPTARIEMLMQQWLLSRAEFCEFLPTRVMVVYPEPWMDRVDAMKTIMGWTDTSVMHFHNLAVFGEQILLSIRYGAWSVVVEPTQAFNFARFWRPQVQGYIHSYRAATGVELGAEIVDSRVDATLPSVLLHKRLAYQQRSF